MEVWKGKVSLAVSDKWKKATRVKAPKTTRTLVLFLLFHQNWAIFADLPERCERKKLRFSLLMSQKTFLICQQDLLLLLQLRWACGWGRTVQVSSLPPHFTASCRPTWASDQKKDEDARAHNKPRREKQIESLCWTGCVRQCEYAFTATRHRAHVHSYTRTSRRCNRVACWWFGERVLSSGGSTWRWNRSAWCLQEGGGLTIFQNYLTSAAKFQNPSQ